MILAGTTAIVTGGGVRIGRAIALHLARHGVNIGLHFGSSRSEAQETAQLLRESGVKTCLLQGDLRTPVSSAREIFETARHELGPIQILINNAAMFRTGSLQSTTEADWDDHQNINLKAPFFLTQMFARNLPETASGCVINIADWRGTAPVPGHASYTIAKAGLIAQTRLLAQELGPRIRVNAIAPGAILPPPDGSISAFEDRGKAVPLRQTGTPDDILKAVDYLLTAPFVTGELLHVTGGEQLLTGYRPHPKSS